MDAQSGMLIETTWLLPVTIVYLLFFADSPTSNLANNTVTLNLLLAAAGVITTIPLLCFTAAATRLPLSTLGFFQYIGPTLTFTMAIMFYGEKATSGTLMTFGFIWAGLAVFIWDALSNQSKRAAN